MTCREYVLANLSDLQKMGYDERLAKIARETGTSRDRSRKIYRLVEGAPSPEAPAKPPSVDKVCLTRQEFLEVYDTDLQALTRLRETLSKLNDDDRLFTASGFWTEFLADVPWKSFKKVAGYPEFRDHRVKIDGVVYWTSPTTRNWALARIAKAREC